MSTLLHRTAAANNKSHLLKPWHNILCKYIPALAVYHLFLECRKDANFIIFENEKSLQKAKKFEDDLKRAFPLSKMVVEGKVIQFDTTSAKQRCSDLHRHAQTVDTYSKYKPDDK